MFGLRPWTIGLTALGGIAAVGAITHIKSGPPPAPGTAETTGSGSAEAAPAPGKRTPAPLPNWSSAALKQLLDAVDSAQSEGLHPADYKRDALAAIVASGRSGADVDALAEAAARALGHDFAAGRVPERKRIDWHIPAPAALATLEADLDNAVRADRVGAYLRGLLPADPRYAALRDALRTIPASDADRLTAIRATMERWRWMPRAFGPDYLLVNIPAYQVTLYAGGEPVETHVAIAGSRKTPTPQLAAAVQSVVVNPWWTLPPTVLAEGKHYSAAKGYITVKIAGGTRIRQKPGPMNALGRFKLNMPNPYAIYLHDTPAKGGFLKTDRALSHGCIRVKDVQQLAERIGDPAAIADALKTTDTRTLGLAKPVPIFITYLTAVPDADGTVAILPDPYDRDAGVVAALDGTPVASRPALTPAPPKPAEPAEAAAPAQPAPLPDAAPPATPAPPVQSSPTPKPAPPTSAPPPAAPASSSPADQADHPAAPAQSSTPPVTPPTP